MSCNIIEDMKTNKSFQIEVSAQFLFIVVADTFSVKQLNDLMFQRV